MDDCVFCKIVSREIPASIYWEDDNYLAFLDIIPIKPGHSLLIPKKHESYVFDLSDEEISGIFKASKKVSHLLKKAFNPKSGKIGIVVYGLDVDHVHIHLVPIDKTGDLDFNRKKPVTKEELSKALTKIKSASSS